MRKGESRLPTARKASTMPRRTVWLMASVSMDMRRRTRKFPGRAQAADMKMAIRSISAKEFIIGLLP